MKLSVGVLLLGLVCASAIDVNMLRGKKSVVEQGKPDAFDNLCNELSSFSSEWSLEYKKMTHDYGTTKQNVNDLEVSFGTLGAAEKKIADKKKQVGIANRDISNSRTLLVKANQELDNFQGNVANAKAQKKRDAAEIKVRFTKEQANLKTAQATLKTQETSLKAENTKLAALEKELEGCLGEQGKKSEEYAKFKKMSETVVTQTKIVEKSMAVVESKTITKKSTSKVSSKYTYDLDTMEKVYEDSTETTIEKKYKLITQSVASVRTEMTMKTNALTEYLMQTDAAFAASVNADMQKKLDEKQKKSIAITKEMMKTEIKDQTDIYNRKNGKRLRFAKASLMSAAEALNQHLLDNAAVMDAHLQHYAQHHHQASLCRSSKGAECSGIAMAASKGSFAVKLEKATAQYTSMIDTMCVLKGNIDTEAKKYLVLLGKQAEDKKLNDLLNALDATFKKLQKAITDIEGLIQTEKASLISVQKAAAEYQRQWSIKINNIVVSITETNSKATTLANFITAAANQAAAAATKTAGCKKTIAKIDKDKEALLKQARTMMEISTSSTNSLATTVKEESTAYDHIAGANEDLNNLITGFTKLGSEAKYFTKADWRAGGKEYYSKRDAGKK